jgi:hypothetical protein
LAIVDQVGGHGIAREPILATCQGERTFTSLRRFATAAKR